MKIKFLKVVKLFLRNQFLNNEKNYLCSYELKGQKSLADHSFILTYMNECLFVTEGHNSASRRAPH